MSREELALIGGEWSAASSDAWLEVVNPADTREIVGKVPALSVEDVERAYVAAEHGFATWRATNPVTRAEVLAGAARLIGDRLEEFVGDLVAEMGKTAAEARGEVAKTAEFFSFYSGLLRAPDGYLLNDARPGTTTSVRYEPVGTVLAITPWNDPLLTPARKLAPALAAGNAVVLKPATETPLVALRLARCLTEAGLPDGVLNVVTGRGRDLSAPLLENRAVRAVTFTGSTDVGLDIQKVLAGRNIRVQTEMGGKNAAVVLADADLELAAATIAAAAFGQAGQRCTATSRVIVDHRVRGDLVNALLDHARSLRLGPGDQPATSMGPVVSEGQRDGVLGHIANARADGAEVQVGGDRPNSADLAYGCFVEPTVLCGVTREMAIWRDEVFGPVVAVHEVNGLDEAIAAVNDSPFGLSASLFTDSLAASSRFCDQAEVGQVAVNLPTSGWDPHIPFGGFRDSGSPFKEQGVEALRFYTRVKTCAVRAMSEEA